MRILYLTKRYISGKDSVKDRFGRFYHLPQELSALGAEVSVIACDTRYQDGFADEINGVPTKSISLGPLSPGGTARIIFSIRSFSPDIVIAGGHTYVGLFGWMGARSCKASFVFDATDFYPAFPDHRLAGMHSLFRFCVKHADMLMCVSKPLADYLDAATSIVIPNGFDPATFHPIPKDNAIQSLNLDPAKQYVGYFGSIGPRSNFDTILKAVSLVSEDRPEIQLLCAGLREKGYDLPMSHRILYLGMLPHESIPTAINACDVVLLPYNADSINPWGFPWKATEYLACQRPVVYSDVGVLKRIYSDAPEGLCDPRDPRSVANAVATQLDSPQICKPRPDLTWSSLASQLLEHLRITSQKNPPAQ